VKAGSVSRLKYGGDLEWLSDGPLMGKGSIIQYNFSDRLSFREVYTAFSPRNHRFAPN
jgi:hypothetical protein